MDRLLKRRPATSPRREFTDADRNAQGHRLPRAYLGRSSRPERRSGASRLDFSEEFRRFRLRVVAYKLHYDVTEVRQTEIFSQWLRGLADTRAKAKIAARIDCLAHGNPGDVAPVGEGVSELRIDFGPGYRVYFVTRGRAVAILLCGGDKAGQAKDIKTAKQLARDLEK